MTGLEALELLGYLKDYHLNAIPYYEWLNDIEKYILKAEKEHKALEIIFEKYVSIFWIKECRSVEEYNYCTANYMELTEEDFNFLKEVIMNG